MEQHQNNLANWLPEQLYRKNYNIGSFCIRCGLSRRAFYYYMHDTMRPTKATLLKMCEALDIAPKEIFEQVQYKHQSYGSHQISSYPKHVEPRKSRKNRQNKDL